MKKVVISNPTKRNALIGNMEANGTKMVGGWVVTGYKKSQMGMMGETIPIEEGYAHLMGWTTHAQTTNRFLPYRNSGITLEQAASMITDNSQPAPTVAVAPIETPKPVIVADANAMLAQLIEAERVAMEELAAAGARRERLLNMLAAGEMPTETADSVYDPYEEAVAW